MLPLPDNTFQGRVTAGAGAWLAGVAGADGPNQAVRWHGGEVESLGLAFGMDTSVAAVSEEGVVVGTATGPDGNSTRTATATATSTTVGVRRLVDSAGRQRPGRLRGPGATSALVVWPVDGPVRLLDLPPEEAPYGQAAIVDDGTVAARTGHVAAGELRWRGYAWIPDGTRLALPEDDVQDLWRGQIVGATGDPDGVTTAARWRADRSPRPYLGGATAVAVNDEGLVVGAGRNGEPLLWGGGVLPTQLPTPPRHLPGAVTAVNKQEAAATYSKTRTAAACWCFSRCTLAAASWLAT